jgi:hypothetical protein
MQEDDPNFPVIKLFTSMYTAGYSYSIVPEVSWRN